MKGRILVNMTRMIIIALTLLSAGCGYRFVDSTSVRTAHFIEVSFFENRTMKANIEPFIADAISAELALRGWRVGKGGDHILRGTIASYEIPPASYSRQDKIVEYRAKMTVDATLTEKETGRTVWARRFFLQQEYPFDPSYSRQENNEEAAINEMSRDLARDIHLALLTELQELQ